MLIPYRNFILNRNLLIFSYFIIDNKIRKIASVAKKWDTLSCVYAIDGIPFIEP